MMVRSKRQATAAENYGKALQMQFSLRRLFLGVTAIAIIAALARLALTLVVLALVSGVLSIVAIALPVRLARFTDDRDPSMFAVMFISLFAGGLLIIGVFLGVICVWASVNVIVAVFRG
jgi:hypothetical protein